MKNGYMFFLNLANASKKAIVFVIPLVMLTFLSFYYKLYLISWLILAVLLVDISFAVIHAPTDRMALDALEKFYSDFEGAICDGEGCDGQQAVFLKAWQIKGGMRLKRYVNGNFIFPHPMIMCLYKKYGEIYFKLAHMSLLKETDAETYCCKLSDDGLLVTSSRISQSNEVTALHIKLPYRMGEIDVMIDNTYKGRGFLELLVDRVGDIEGISQGQGKSSKVDVSDINPVIRARAYGCVKKETFLMRFNELLLYVMQICAYGFLIGIVVFDICFLLICMEEIGLLIFCTVVLCILWFVVLHRYIKRYEFFRKLHKLCKKNKYRLNFKRRFLSTFKYHGDDCDIVLEAGSKVYFIRILTVKKNCTLMLDGEDHAQTIYPPVNGGSMLVFYNREIYEVGRYSVRTPYTHSLKRLTVKLFDLDLSRSFPTVDGKEAVKVIVVDPVPNAIYKVEGNSGMQTVRSGDCVEDIMIYTARRFIIKFMS